MTFDIAFVFGLVIVAVALFGTEKLRVDLVALIIVAALLVSGILTPQEGLLGFSNIATVTVTAMFVLSGGLLRTGAVVGVGRWLTRMGKGSSVRITLVLFGLAGLLSAFINNTTVVAILMPIVLAVARDTGTSPSKLLMPLSFAAVLGGVCTLIGTSTNILVSSMAVDAGLPAFGMFEFTILGGIMFLVGGLYMALVGIRLIPDRRSERDLLDSFAMHKFLTDIVLRPDSPSVGQLLDESPLKNDLDIDVLEIRRDGERAIFPPGTTILLAGDQLRVRGDIEKIRRSQETEGISLAQIESLEDTDLTSEEAVLVEAIVAPGSTLDGRSIKGVRFRSVYGATVLAVRHREELAHDNLLKARLSAGDSLLLEVRRDRFDQLRAQSDFVLVSEVGSENYRTNRMPYAIAITAAVVGVAALNILPIVVTALLGCIAMILTRCLTLEEAYRAIEWKVIFLLAGALSLGLALDKTGAAVLISSQLVASIGDFGPIAILSAIYLMTTVLTESMSNNATAALMVPIALATASSVGIDPRPMLMAVAFGSSVAFMTPIGYQTNTMIYGPGQYRFADFLKVGTPLNLIMWAIATFLIPLIWPL